MLGSRWRLEVGEDEVLPGFVLRIAGRAGVTPLDVLASTGFLTGQPLLNQLLVFNGDVEFAAEALGLDIRDFFSLQMIPPLDFVPRGASDGAVAVQSGLLRHFSRCCPRCIGESGGVWKKQWRVATVVACPVHRVLLRGSCPRCEQRWFGDSRSPSEGMRSTGVRRPFPLDVRLPESSRCHALVDGRVCGFPIEEARTAPISEELSAAMLWLLEGWEDRGAWWSGRGRSVWKEARRLVRLRSPGLPSRSLGVPEDPSAIHFLDDVLAAVDAVQGEI